MRALFTVLLGLLVSPLYAQFLSVDFQSSANNKEVEVYLEGQLFTKLIYPDSLTKYVLHPIYSPSGVEITRGYPLIPRRGESTDHPHQVGLWFTFGDVNGVDFWNNSSARPKEERCKYGTIRLNGEPVISIPHANLTVNADWLDCDDAVLLKEKTVFYFDGSSDSRTIRRETTLKADNRDVLLKGNKEGLFGLRVDRHFESAMGGHYINASGDEGDAVWGKRAPWVSLSGKKEQREITITLYDVPGNPNYPAWAHARGYGLFALNNIGGHEFNPKDEEAEIHLEKGDSVFFMHIFSVSESALP